MKALLNKAALYTPEVLVDFILDLESSLDLENKALFRGIFVQYFLGDRLTYTDKPKSKITNKNGTRQLPR